MNERIRELMGQANKYSLSNVNRDSEFFHSIAMKKFAELIVRECMGLFDPQDTDSLYPPDGIREIIQEHFGVE